MTFSTAQLGPRHEPDGLRKLGPNAATAKPRCDVHRARLLLVHSCSLQDRASPFFVRHHVRVADKQPRRIAGVHQAVVNRATGGACRLLDVFDQRRVKDAV